MMDTNDKMKMIWYDEVRQHFWKLRKEAKISRLELCQRSNGEFLPKTVERFETGKSIIDLDKMQRLYALLGIKIGMMLVSDQEVYDKFYGDSNITEK